MMTKIVQSRRFRRLTAPWRALPDFLIIGAQRSGTTSLYNYLAQHPAMVAASEKEVTYFNQAERVRYGLNWYRSHFPLKSFKLHKRDGHTPITGEATPEYLFFPHAAHRIAEALPAARLIVLLRNPAHRAYSNYEMNIKKGREDYSFEEALEKESERTDAERQKMLADQTYFSRDFHRYSYRARGLYAEQLETWFQFYPREQFLILRSEDMFERPSEIYTQVLSFLGLPHWKLPQFEQFNSARRSKLKPETLRELSEYYAPHNQKLYELLSRDFRWEEDVPELAEPQVIRSVLTE